MRAGGWTAVAGAAFAAAAGAGNSPGIIVAGVLLWISALLALASWSFELRRSSPDPDVTWLT